MATANRSDALRVLFLGNSYTYYNNLPRMVEEFAAAGQKMETRMIAPGGDSLADHLVNSQVLEAIRSGGWDFVVLQEQSQLGAVYLVNGKARVANAEAFFAAARELDKEIRKAGAKTMLFHTWPGRDAPDSDRAMLDYAYMRMARELGATLAPVGMAWQQARAALPDVNLYDADGSHPSPHGSYLAAAVIYAAMSGANPVGGSARITGAPVDVDSGAVDENRVDVLVDLSSRVASHMQRIAWNAHKELATAGGALDLRAPPPPPLPQVPAGGRRPTPSDLAGRWTGWLRLYPVPTVAELRIAKSDAKFSATIEISTTGDNPRKLTHELEHFEITDTGIAFVDPSGPNGGTVRYRAIFAGNQLVGVAEATVTDAPVYAIGTFELSRASGTDN